AIILDESDPDVYGPNDCTFCGHLRVYHEPGGCIQPDCDCTTFKAEAPGETVEEQVETPAEAPPDVEEAGACAHCGHPEGVHGTTRKRGCMRAECDCKGYMHPDPLGVANVHAEPEKREAEL
ncbi:MAG: hypothetical protein MUQ56_09165, partial [Thermoleophilia bacterium]|nr:hypothetical protein [Thermoleophilia bacterium]